MQRVWALPALFALLAGCGAESGRSVPRAQAAMAARAALDALARGDAAFLAEVTTVEARQALAADLRAWCRGLPERAEAAPALHARLQELFGLDAPRILARARAATAEEALRFHARLAGGVPRAEIEVVSRGPEREVFAYEDRTGVRRPLPVVRGADGWRVERLAP